MYGSEEGKRRVGAAGTRLRGQGKRRTESGDDGLGLLRELTPRHSYDAEPRGRQRGVAAAITLERRARAVEGVAVDPHHEPLVAVEDVDLVAGDADVGGAGWKPGAAEEGEERAFGFGAGYAGALGLHRDEAEHLCLVRGALERGWGEEGAEVFEGAGRGGDSEAVAGRGLVGCERAGVGVQSQRRTADLERSLR